MERFLTFLDPGEESALLASAAVQVFDTGDVLLAQNAAQQAIYVIDRGSVAIERENGMQYVELAILAPGEFFGEISFVDGAPTSARVVAREPTSVRVLTPDLIANLDQPDPTFGHRFYKSLAAILADRLRRTSLHVW
jgi:extracellular factor (EF) 3-hydroxypalmitic acid methyl ester biosynthesis protein